MKEIKRIKASQIPDATNIDGFKAFGIKVNTDGTVDNVKVPMDLLKGNKGDTLTWDELTQEQKSELAFTFEDFTAEQIEALKVKGDAFTFEDFTAEQIEALKVKGDKGDANSLSIGTVESGASAGASITGEAPNQTLNLTLPKGDTGSNIELQKTTTHVQWRVVGGTWANLIPLSDLKGDKGDNISLQKTATHIQWRLGTGTWVDLVALAELKGDTGANIELQKSSTHVQWRVQGADTWNNLIPIDDLKVKGDTGANIELQKSTTHVQWRVVGTTTWNNLVALSELKGEKGDAPVKGVDYFDGKNPVMIIGTITTVASNAEANATVEPDGVDAEGKPKFKLNLWLPKGVDGEGSGDMLESIYDPQGKNTDIFGYVDGKVKTDVPVNAKFTDTTYTEISEAEIDTGTASTLRAVTARRTTYILNKVQALINSAISALTKSSVGLSNVDNVKQIPMSEKGANGGVAELDSTGKVLSSQLPSYVDDVLEYATLTNFPTTGETGKIYIAINTNLTYRWTGSAYTEVSPSIALGETSATAYRGDRGKIAYDHSQVAHAPANAQKNSDITKAEIEAKLTGDINTHTHNQYIESSKFQVVESLPASPLEGVFYFVKE